jgi:hypothetical protein
MLPNRAASAAATTETHSSSPGTHRAFPCTPTPCRIRALHRGSVSMHPKHIVPLGSKPRRWIPPTPNGPSMVGISGWNSASADYR